MKKKADNLMVDRGQKHIQNEIAGFIGTCDGSRRDGTGGRMKHIKREQILQALNRRVEKKEPILICEAGIGAVAKMAEAAGIDLIVISSVGRMRMNGMDDAAAYRPYGNCNDFTKDIAIRIRKIVKHTPVIAGIGPSDPYRDIEEFEQELFRMGILFYCLPADKGSDIITGVHAVYPTFRLRRNVFLRTYQLLRGRSLHRCAVHSHCTLYEQGHFGSRSPQCGKKMPSPLSVSMIELIGTRANSDTPIPSNPAQQLIIKVSALNTCEILRLDAPRARRIPISFVRSITEMCVIIPIIMQETTREIATKATST